MLTSVDPRAAASGHTGVCVAVIEGAEAVVIGWIPVGTFLCVVIPRGSCKLNSFHCDEHNLVAVPACELMDGSPDVIKNNFNENSQYSLRITERGDITILSGDLIAPVGRMFVNSVRLEAHFGPNFCSLEDEERLFFLSSYHRLFLASAKFRRPHRQYVTYFRPYLNHRLTQND